MTTPSSQQVTQLLRAWSNGDLAAEEKLMRLVYRELRRLAQRYMGRERPDHALQATALVNEAYLRLIDARQVSWQNRAHFFGVSAQLMRRILVDWARARGYQKRAGQAHQVSLDEALVVTEERGGEAYEYYPLGEYVVVAPGVCGSRPTFKGTRLEAQVVLDLIEAGWSQERILKELAEMKGWEVEFWGE